MSTYALPALFTIAVWWASTGLILLMVRLPRVTFPASLVAATVVLGMGVHGLADTAADTSVNGAYLAFASGIAVWAWVEVSFLLGFITGPRRNACPAGCAGFGHFGHSTAAIIYHELACVAAAAVVAAVTWGEANQVGFATFMVLWIMRLSAKLNLFLGVPNRGEQFLPPHLLYLKSFFGKRSMNALFPVSVTGITLFAGLLIARIMGNDSAVALTGDMLILTLVLLALLEHWFMVLPLPSERLWQWQRPDAIDPGSPDLRVALPLAPGVSASTLPDHKNTPPPSAKVRPRTQGEFQ